MVIDLSFAERIINKYKKFGRYHLDTPSLVLFDAVRQPFFYRMAEKNSLFRLYFPLPGQKNIQKPFPETPHPILSGPAILKQLRQEISQISVKNIQNEAEKIVSTRVTRETEQAVRRSLKRETALLGQSITDEMKRHLSHPLPRGIWQTGEKKFDLYYNIASIFENRERQPDIARKTEQKLIRILADDFYGRLPEQSPILRKQTRQEEELIKTRQLVTSLTERLTLQENVLSELKHNRLTLNLSPEVITRITKEVVKKMEWELHLEKIRRGF